MCEENGVDIIGRQTILGKAPQEILAPANMRGVD
jgi:hypothetical protein